MNGFLKPQFSERPEDPTRLRARCGVCRLYHGCRSPKMKVSGDGRKGVLIVTEAPGADDDERGMQLVGKTGQQVRRALDGVSVDLDEDCWKTYALICRPPDNREPTKDEIDHCRPNLIKSIYDLKPRIIVPMGQTAISSLLGSLFRENVGPVARWVGWRIPLQKHNAWVLPTYHPLHVSNSDDDMKGSVIRLWFKRHLAAINRLPHRPWDTVPDYASEVQVVLNLDQASQILDRWREEGGPISFDYETNRLKPDADNAEIVCCAVCYKGKETISFPWMGSAIASMKQLLESDCPKIGANAKFETRWTRRLLKTDVKNWRWDTMLSAHHLDCRRGITSVKFQAFVRLGVEPWDHHIKPYLKSVGDTGVNRIHELDLKELLVYCGMDALVEYKLAQDQKNEMRIGANWYGER